MRQGSARADESSSTAAPTESPLTVDPPEGMVATFRPVRPPSAPFIVALLLGILCLLAFMVAAPALFVFGVGVALAFFLVPVVNWLEHRGWPRWIAAALTVAVTLATIVIISLIVILIVIEQGVAFVQNLPQIRAEIETWYLALDLPGWLRAGLDVIIGQADDVTGATNQGTIVAGVIGGVVGLFSGLFAWFLLPFFLFYLLKDQPRMAGSFYARVPDPWRDNVSSVLTIGVGNVAQYFKAEFVVGSIMFVIVALGAFVIGGVLDAPLLQKFALLLGLVALVMELIPQIGPILSYIPALLLAIPAGFETVAVISVFYFIVFNIEGSILVPNIEGKMISFTGATVLVLIAVGFALAGIIGAILALPVASIVRDLFRHFFDQAVRNDTIYVPDEAAGGSAGPAGDAAGT
jgi:predicted PurR-regulated permease PerM